jgi:two-component system chemotaxis sensor kinase CheA
MAETLRNESVECELRQLVDELAARSMSDLQVDAAEARIICERFAMLPRLAAEADLGELSELGQSLLKVLEGADVTRFVPSLRDAVTQMQERVEAVFQEHKAPADTRAVDRIEGIATDEDMSLADPSLVADFVVESREHLVAAEEQALALEKVPDDAEAINALFRAFHSIKGLAAFLGFDRVYRFAHEVETLLDYARNREIVVTSSVVDVILASADFLSRCMDAIQGGDLSTVPSIEQPLVERIRKTIEEGTKPPESCVIASEAAPAIETTPVPQLLEIEKIEQAEVAPVQSAAKSERPAQIAVKAPQARSEAIEISAPPAEAKAQGAERYSIRVETTKLDYLMDMVGELVIAQSLVRTEILDQANPNSNLTRSITQLTQITSDVQRTTLSMRMIPIGQLMRRTARIVRDLARKFGKQVEVSLEGEDTEVDKTIAEELADPLMHIVRNAIDHGIESPEQRLAAGKNPLARICLSASHEGSQIVVQVSDDGKGLDRSKILKKARERNLVSDVQLTDADIVELIFSPGFSTADQVTDVSGRGVGMDVVRRHVEKLRGRVDVESRPGAGTRFMIRLPLTRAIIDGLVVKVGDSRYVIPLSSVREIFRPVESSVSTVQAKGELVLLHDRLLPIVRLHREFSIASAVTDPCAAVLIVAESEGRQFCLMVDDLIGKQEVVVKNLGCFLESTPGVSGGTILGDGRVGLILDVQRIEVRA